MHRLSFLVQAERRRFRLLGVLVAALCAVLVSLIGAPPAGAKPRSPKCRGGTLPAKVGKKTSCVSLNIVQPPPSKANPFVAQLQGALGFAEVDFKAPSGKRGQSLSQQFGRSWVTAQGRLEGAFSGMLTRVQRTTRTPLAYFATASSADSANCAILDAIGNSTSFKEPGPDGKTVQINDSATIDGVDVTIGFNSGGMHMGLKTTFKGDLYTMKFDSGDVSCLAYKLPPCPEADGSLHAYGLKGKIGFSLTVARGGKVLHSESYAQSITVDTKGQVADDAMLDYVDVTYNETTKYVRNGFTVTDYGNRKQRINMREGGYGPEESVSFGSTSGFGQSINTAGQEADAKDFATFVQQTKSAYKSRQEAWQKPNTCAKLKLNPASGTLTLSPGATGSFSAEVDAAENGDHAAKASWTLGAQQNGSFSPTSSKDAQPSFSYEVSGNPSGETVSVAVKATSTAGVAEETWSQKVGAIKTISGTFSGHEDEEDGVRFDWSGTATFTRAFSAVGATHFQLSSGQATVTVSGTSPDGCTHSGTEQIPLFEQSIFDLLGTSKPFQYTIDVPWDTRYDGAGVTESCPEQPPFQTTEIPAATALQSGEIGLSGIKNPSELNPSELTSGLLKTSADGITFNDSAGEHDVAVGAASWNWSLKGSP